MPFSGVRFKLLYRFEPGEKLDGVTICVSENALNLLPGNALDYPVPGFYADFAEFLLRKIITAVSVIFSAALWFFAV